MYIEETESEEDDESLVFGNIKLCENVANNVFLPSVSNCSEYYRCTDGNATKLSCDPKYLFDARSQRCDLPENVKCFQNCNDLTLKSFCYDRTCTKYVLCYYMRPVLRQCYDGLQYNAETDRCDFPEYVDCVDDLCPVFNNPENILYMASKAQCDKYFLCVNGWPVVQNCTQGLQFNKDCDCCDLPSRANCTVSALQRNIKPFSRSPPRRADITCPSEGAYFFAHKTRPDAYYYCLDGNGITLDCTPGLLYDANLEECREPQYILS